MAVCQAAIQMVSHVSMQTMDESGHLLSDIHTQLIATLVVTVRHFTKYLINYYGCVLSVAIDRMLVLKVMKDLDAPPAL